MVGQTDDIQRLNGPGDWDIAELALRQHGVVAYRQLVAMGFGEGAIRHRIRNGRLHRVHHGVYAVGHRVLTTSGRWMAAVLACGEGAALSHRDGAALWDLRRSARFGVDVTTTRARGKHAGVTAHRVRRLDRRDCTVHEGIPVTTVARTLLDVAEVLLPWQLERVVEQAERLNRFDLNAVDATIERNPGRRGRKPLLAVIAALRPFAPWTRSEFERAFLELCRAAGLPEPDMNLWVEGYEVDALFADKKVIVELDGGDYHETTAARRRDPIRDFRLQLAGYRVLRVSDRWLARAPHEVTELLRTSLR